MEAFDRRSHWEKIYQTKPLEQVSWYQPMPKTSLEFIAETGLPPNARIIDIGGGDSFLVDHLLAAGYTNLTVLDISEEALKRAKQRLGDRAEQVEWIVSDVTEFQPTGTYDLWHDRAAFHFLTSEEDIAKYQKTTIRAVKPGGCLVLETFSEQGPENAVALTSANILKRP